MALEDEMTFEIQGTGGNAYGSEWVYAEGKITKNTVGKFLQFINSDHSGKLPPIVFNSLGGNLNAGLQLGLIIREQKLCTEVGRSLLDEAFGLDETPRFHNIVDGGKCGSACVWAFLGGVERKAKGVQIGVHQFSYLKGSQVVFSAETLSQDQIQFANLIEYTIHMGVDPKVVALTGQCPAADVRWLTEKEVNETRVNWQPNNFGPWQLDAYKGGVQSLATSQDNTKLAMIYANSKGQKFFTLKVPFSMERDWYEDMYNGIDGLFFWGQNISKDYFVYLYEANSLILKIDISNIQIEKLDPYKGIQIDGPHCFCYVFDLYNFSAQNFIENALITFRVPIGS